MSTQIGNLPVSQCSSSGVCFGSQAAIHETEFQYSNLNDCFTQQRPFKAEENYENDRQLTARSRRSTLIRERPFRLVCGMLRRLVGVERIHRTAYTRPLAWCPSSNMRYGVNGDPLRDKFLSFTMDNLHSATARPSKHWAYVVVVPAENRSQRYGN